MQSSESDEYSFSSENVNTGSYLLYFRCLPIVTLFLLGATLSTATAAQSYRILLTNDDGIASPLLHALHDEIAAMAGVEVVVAAPSENQSGSSHSSTGGQIVVTPYHIDDEFYGYAVHGRPADAVRFGLLELGNDDPFDLVISGINRGANVGDVSHLSGTVGAAMEGIYQGVAAIAVSQETSGVNTESSARFVVQLVERYREQGAPPDVLISINIPAGELLGVRVRPMGDSYLQTTGYRLLERNEERTVYESERVIVQSVDDTTDTYAYQQGYITLTPIKFDWTAGEFIDDVQAWNLQLPE